MREQAVADRLLGIAADPVTGSQRRILAEIATMYEREGAIVDGRGRPLWSGCAHARDCWRVVSPSRRIGSDLPTDDLDEQGGICLPWVGPTYTPGGVAMLAINLRMDSPDDGGLETEHHVAHHQLTELARGAKKIYQSDFAFFTVTALAIVSAWKSGDDPCLLPGELSILRPSVLLVFGSDPRWAMGRLGAEGLDHERAPKLRFGKLNLHAESMELLCLPHPQARGGAFKRALESLRDELRQRTRGDSQS